MDDLDEKAQRLRVLWKSGRDKYVSFFSVLSEVRREIGEDALPNWCFDHLRIGFSAIANATLLLQKTDAEIVKRDLAAARKAAREQRAAQKEQARQTREAERVARELGKAAHDKRIAEARVESERAKAEAERAKAETQKERKKTQRKKNADTGKRERKRRAFIAGISDAELSALVKKFKEAEKLCQHGEGEWIEGSIMIALILHAARTRLTHNHEFSAWLETNNIYPGDINRDNRTALIGLGSLGEERLREILVHTESRSYRSIWKDNRVIPSSQRCEDAEECSNG